MRGLFSKVQAIMDKKNDDYTIEGTVVYVLTNEEDPYSLYRLNLENNEDIEEIINNNIQSVNEETEFYTYTQCTEPNGRETLSYVSDIDIPNYNVLKNKIITDQAVGLNKKDFIEKISMIKGYAIRVLYNDIKENTQGHIICYSNLNRTYLFRTKKSYFKFSNEDGDLLKKVDDTYIKFNDRIVAVNIEETVFVFHGYYFEQMLKYDEHINNAATIVLGELENQSLITNMDLIKEKSKESKNVRKKLFAINKEGDISKTTFDKFRELKNRYGGGLKFNLDVNNSKISIQEENKNKSIDHILRIYNDEGAETFLSQKFIFANQKIPIE